MVRFENVSYNPPYRSSGLKDINLQINKGEFVFITAQTAEYKTTLLNLIYGKVLPTTGKIGVLGYCLPDNRKEIPLIRKDIGYIFHSFLFFDNLTVRENLYITLKVKSYHKNINIEEKIENMLKKIHTHLKPDTQVSRLSSGEKQTLNFFRALITDPLIILADDPFKHFHKSETDKFLSLLEEEQRKGVTIIVTTGNPSIPESLNKTYYTLKGGRIATK